MREAAGILATAAAALPILAEAALAQMPAGFKTGTELVRAGEWDDGWPFSVHEGDLTCIEFGGQRYVFFAEIAHAAEASEPRDVVVSTNPFALFATYENRDLYLHFDTLETLIARLGPMEAHGTRLCDGETAN